MAPTTDISALREDRTKVSPPEAEAAVKSHVASNETYTLSRPSQLVRDVGAALKVANDKVNAFRK